MDFQARISIIGKLVARQYSGCFSHRVIEGTQDAAPAQDRIPQRRLKASVGSASTHPCLCSLGTSWNMLNVEATGPFPEASDNSCMNLSGVRLPRTAAGHVSCQAAEIPLNLP